MSRLCELAEKYGSDKVPSIFHSYTPFYDELLRGRDVKRVLEIGIGSVSSMNHVKDYKPGASLRMWSEYFPDADIVGVDNDQSVLFQDNRITTMYGDQSSEQELKMLVWQLRHLKFDLIIDDGSHVLQHQALTANALIPNLLAPAGVYVIEDVMYRRELYSALPFPAEVKIFNLRRTPDDCLFYIEGSKL